MLLELRVENYAVIDHVTVEFAAGLNLLTGETGAGKSLLIDALALLLGDKASSDVVRHGAEKAVLSAVFSLDGKGAASILEANGIECDGDELILKREVAAGGKGRVWVNNQPATVSVLKQLAPELAAVHAQNESLLGFDAAARLKLLDSFAGVALRPLQREYQAWRALRERISELERGEQDRLRLLDLWNYQKQEIDAARLQPEEDLKLESEKRVLANAEKLYAAATSAYQSLYEAGGSALEDIRAAARNLEELARIDARFAEQVAQLAAARAMVEDVSAAARDYADAIDASPERLAEVEDRLAALDRLKRKYGSSVSEVLAFAEDLAQKLNEIENRDDIIRGLRQELAVAAGAYLGEARTLSKARANGAAKLQKLVEGHVNDLAMKARFRVEVAANEDPEHWTESGFDTVLYLIAANAGDPLRPVEQIASGGELSRVMLALKTSIEEGRTRSSANGRGHAGQRTLVFDEVDAGIGGRAAEAVGKKLKALARGNQVLCVTHLPQIASFADRHLLIEKRTVAGRSKTAIRALDAEQRREEIARMLSGAKLTEASLEHAAEMLKANA